jgi:uncharacterized protein YgiM (DUF1202 family)
VTAELIVRSGPGLDQSVITTHKPGVYIKGTGKIKKKWLPISFNGGTAYVYTQWVKAKNTTKPLVTGTKRKLYTTKNVNIRSKAKTKSTLVKKVKKNTKLTVTGRTSGKYSEIKYSGKKRWVYTAYLSEKKTLSETTTTPDAPQNIVTPLPAVVGEAITTSVLSLRADSNSSASLLATLPAGSQISLTGNHANQYSQVVYGSQSGWVLTGYYRSATAGMETLTGTSNLYINATDVNLREGPGVETGKIAVLAYGTLLVTTGVTQNGYTQVIFGGVLRWVSSQYLTTVEPGAGNLGSETLNRLGKYGQAAVLAVRQAFPEVKTIYGWRSSSAYAADHTQGRAIDIMMPYGSSNGSSAKAKQSKELGDRIAKWVIANASSLHVEYLIWRQRNYRISRGTWVNMADRGSDTENHYDHVHVTFFAS